MRDVFHPGEKLLQEHCGVGKKMQSIGARVIRDYMPEQHRAFFAQQHQILVGGEDQDGNVWASVVYGEPGFLSSPAPQRLLLSTDRLFSTTVFSSGDPLASSLNSHSHLGLLGIEFETRRRNRVNVTVGKVDQANIDLHVSQSFGNCPKYIQQRKILARQPVAPRRTTLGELTEEALSMVARADTLFLASRYLGNHRSNEGVTLGRGGEEGVGFDVSHRGGLPGFVRYDGETLWIPDYSGNNFFNTLGNLALDPKLGLLVMDFDNRSYLQLSGDAEVVTNEADVPFRELSRAIAFRPALGAICHDCIPWVYSSPDYSPFCPDKV